MREPFVTLTRPDTVIEHRWRRAAASVDDGEDFAAVAGPMLVGLDMHASFTSALWVLARLIDRVGCGADTSLESMLRAFALSFAADASVPAERVELIADLLVLAAADGSPVEADAMADRLRRRSSLELIVGGADAVMILIELLSSINNVTYSEVLDVVFGTSTLDIGASVDMSL